MNSQLPEGYVILGTGEELEALGLTNHPNDLMYRNYYGEWEQTTYDGLWCIEVVYAAEINSPTHVEWLIATSDTKLPKCPFDVGESLVYIGTGQFLQEHGVEKRVRGLKCRSGDWNGVVYTDTPWNPGAHYAAELGSPALDAFLTTICKQQGEPAMNDNPFTIRTDGSLSYKDHSLSADDTRRLYQYLTADRLHISGHPVKPVSLKIGCQHIKAVDVQAFVDEYARGEWKKPCTMRLGSHWRDSDGDEYILARVGNHNLVLISPETGENWRQPTKCEPLGGDEYAYNQDVFGTWYPFTEIKS